MSRFQKLAGLGVNMLRIAATNPRRLIHVLGSAHAASEEVCDPALDLLRLPLVGIEDLLPASGPEIRATLAVFPWTISSVSVLESVALALLIKKCSARNVFEFGTYKGLSTSQLALNIPPDGRVFTLDLPENDPRSAFAITDPEDIAIANEKDKGVLVPADLRPRVEFLKQDSATFDERPYSEKMDFVFVDGAHNADYVRNDSEKAMRMVRPGGIVAWHDFRIVDPAVVRFLVECPYKPSRIAGTALAFAIK